MCWKSQLGRNQLPEVTGGAKTQESFQGTCPPGAGGPGDAPELSMDALWIFFPDEELAAPCLLGIRAVHGHLGGVQLLIHGVTGPFPVLSLSMWGNFPTLVPSIHKMELNP